MNLSPDEQQKLEEIDREFSRRDPELHRLLASFGAVRGAGSPDVAVHRLLSSSVRTGGWPTERAEPCRRRRRLVGFALGLAVLGALGLPVWALSTADLDPCPTPEAGAAICSDEPSANVTR